MACAWLKLPKMSADPPRIAPWLIAGNETTWPSSTTARSSSGELVLPYWEYIWLVSVPNALAPAPLKFRLTCQFTLDVWGVALADLIWLPSTWAGASTNLSHVPLVPLDSPQATIWFFGLSQICGP